MSVNPYDQDLGKNPANYQPLTPITFLERSAKVYPTYTAIIHGNQRINYATFYERSKQLASALSLSAGIGKGDTVSVMLSNTPSMLECHYGVPMTGACVPVGVVSPAGRLMVRFTSDVPKTPDTHPSSACL